MKFTTKISAGFLSLGLLVAASAESSNKFELPKIGESNTPAPAAPTSAPAAAPAAPAAPKYTEAQLLEAFGYVQGMRMGLRELEFTPAQVEALGKGMARAARGEQPSAEMQGMGPELDQLLQKKNLNFMTKLRDQNRAESAAFFTKLKENKNVQELPSGLRVEILKQGTGAYPKQGQVAKLHYTGALINGQVFDSSLQREPVELPVQVATQENPAGIIPGMAEGLQKLAVGGKAKFYIPPHLAYGDEGGQGIPPAATLIFEVELLEVKDAPKEAPAPAPAK